MVETVWIVVLVVILVLLSTGFSVWWYRSRLRNAMADCKVLYSTKAKQMACYRKERRRMRTEYLF